MTTVDVLRARMQRKIDKLRAKVDALESERNYLAVRLSRSERTPCDHEALSKGLTRALSNIRLIPVHGIRSDDKIVSIEIDNKARKA